MRTILCFITALFIGSGIAHAQPPDKGKIVIPVIGTFQDTTEGFNLSITPTPTGFIVEGGSVIRLDGDIRGRLASIGFVDVNVTTGRAELKRQAVFAAELGGRHVVLTGHQNIVLQASTGTLSGREEFVGGFNKCGTIGVETTPLHRVTGWVEIQGTFVPGVPGSASGTYEGEFTIRGTENDDDDKCE